MPSATLPFRPPERFNIAEYFLDERVDEGRGDRVAIRTGGTTLTYREVRALANRYGSLLREAGVEPEQRVLLALPDGTDFVAALFGTFKIGAVAVMVNPYLRPAEFPYFLAYTRARVALVTRELAGTFREAASSAPLLQEVLAVDDTAFREALAAGPGELENFPTHRDDPALWLFSGGTSGRPKAVVQSHASYANTTECYAKGVIGYTEDDVTISVPKLFFGYATGSNLFFPFAVGGSTVLFPERCTPARLVEEIGRHRPTILVNVPTMVQQMVSDPEVSQADLGSLRLATSAGEALPAPLYHRWRECYGVELLDGLGTAEMWHIFLSNRPGDVRPGTLGRPVPGFEIQLRDPDGQPVPVDEPGFLWVRGDSRAIGYWQRMDRTRQAFHGEWYVSEDVLSRDREGYYTYRGRGDDMLKVAGKWLSPREVENRLLEHPEVGEVAVVGARDGAGLIRPVAYVETRAPRPGLASELEAFLRERIAGYKVPRDFVFVDELPRTHLGKVDRGSLRGGG